MNLAPPAPGLLRSVRSLPLALAAFSVLSCDREERSFRSAPPSVVPDSSLQVGELRAGPPRSDVDHSVYGDNRWAIAQGQRLYSWFNCSGCHSAGGGGAIGPPLRDSIWIYGSAPENLFATIVQGRPDGMPSFGGLIATDDVWKLVAFVRSMARLTPMDTWPARPDDMSGANPQRRAGRPPP